MPVRNCLRSETTMEIFYTTERSNCTEITALFFHRCGLLKEALDYSDWIHNYRWDVYVPSHPTKLEDLMVGSPYKKIKFVRCPYDRAVSCYFIYTTSLHPVQENNVQDALVYPRRIPKTIVSRPHLKPAKDISFLDFLKIIKTKDINRQSSFSVDPHLLTQSFKEELAQPITWDHIIHVETMKEELETIGIQDLDHLQTFRTNLKKNHWNKSSKFIRHSSCLSHVPFRFINTKNVNYADFYNTECKLLVENLYKMDFQCHPEYTWKEFLRRNHRD